MVYELDDLDRELLATCRRAVQDGRMDTLDEYDFREAVELLVNITAPSTEAGFTLERSHDEGSREMNPAALAAASRGDIANMLIASTPGGIERQEAAGQRTLVEGAMLPKEIRGATREQLTALGFKFGADVDELFVICALPIGWTKRATDHSMHSDLLDEQGRRRAGIFYKAAFYDRRADMRMKHRYCVDSYREVSTEAMRRVDVFDCGQVIKEFGEVRQDDWRGLDALEKTAVDWLGAQYPDWKSSLAYW